MKKPIVKKISPEPAKKQAAKKKRSLKSAVSDDLGSGEAEVSPEKPKKGGPPKGNQFWKARSKHGRDKIFTDPAILWEACLEYFEWVEKNPLWEEKGFAFQGVVTHEVFPKMRAMTIDGLCIFLDIGYQTWRDYAVRDDYSEVIARAESVIKSQKFAGAAADLLNANIIARDLGLKDSHEHGGPGGGPMIHEVRRTIVDS